MLRWAQLWVEPKSSGFPGTCLVTTGLGTINQINLAHLKSIESAYCFTEVLFHTENQATFGKV